MGFPFLSMIVVFLLYLALPALAIWGFVKFYRVMQEINDNLSGIRETLATRDR